LQIIRANAVRLGDLASDLQTLSEQETEREPPRQECLAVWNAVESVVRRIEQEAAERQINVVLALGPNPCIMGQPLRFERALLNLLRNAIRFNRSGGGVYLATGVIEGTAQITVRDTGIGIPSAELPRIFERSYCVDKARSRENGGTGLGLAMVKHIVGTMHGTITVESQLGKGTVFTLRFPVASCKDF
jgi:two-component system phosphate regulon sensor histidine kinase PhoR